MAKVKNIIIEIIRELSFLIWKILQERKENQKKDPAKKRNVK